MRRGADLGQGQIEILRYVQDHHPVTVRQVAEHLARTKGLTRTTALNVMERLREKGYLTRALAGGVRFEFLHGSFALDPAVMQDRHPAA